MTTVAESGITFADMRWLANSEARRIDITQDYLIEIGARAQPDKGQLRNKEIFESITRLIDLIVADDVIISRLKSAKAKSSNNAHRGSDAGRRVADSPG